MFRYAPCNPILLFRYAPCNPSLLFRYAPCNPILLFRYAPCNPILLEGEALASAAANRSAAFYQTKQYKECIEDIGNFKHFVR